MYRELFIDEADTGFTRYLRAWLGFFGRIFKNLTRENSFKTFEAAAVKRSFESFLKSLFRINPMIKGWKRSNNVIDANEAFKSLLETLKKLTQWKCFLGSSNNDIIQKSAYFDAPPPHPHHDEKHIKNKSKGKVVPLYFCTKASVAIKINLKKWLHH